MRRKIREPLFKGRHPTNKNELTQKYLREILDYDPKADPPEDGYWTRLVKKNKRRLVGGRAGRIMSARNNQRGYWQIRIDGKNYQASRLAFLYMTGRWPYPDVIHINGDTLDDRWENLKEGDHCIESNQRKKSNRGRRVKLPIGIDTSHNGERFVATTTKGEPIHIGTFDTVKEAIKAHQQFIENPTIKEKFAMSRSQSFRKRLLRTLTAERLQRLHPEEELPNLTLIDILAPQWNPEMEHAVRDCIEALIVMARAEQSLETQSFRTKGLSVVKKLKPEE